MTTLRDQFISLTRRRRDSPPLYKTSFALVMTTATNGALGLFFWVAAARLYPADVVGLGAGGISALQLAATVGWVGLQFTVLTYLPAAGRRSRWLAARIFIAGMAAPVVVGIAFLLVGGDPFDIDYFVGTGGGAIAFLAAASVWAVYSLQDSLLVATRRALLVPLQSAAYNATKIVVLVSLASFDAPWAVLGAWMLPCAALVAIVSPYVFFAALGRDGEPRLPGTRPIVRYTAGQTVASLFSWIPDLLVPLLVLATLGREANAYFYAAWTIGFAMRLLLMNLATALVGEAAHDPDNVNLLVRLFAKFSAVALVPMLGVGLLAPSLILSIFGPDYTAGTSLLMFLVVGLVPFAFTSAVMSVDRLRGRTRAPLILSGVANVAFLALCPPLLSGMGIAGGGAAWLIGQTVAAVVAGVLLRALLASAARA
jgi:O-antigen/teichoic acid export membrane protein